MGGIVHLISFLTFFAECWLFIQPVVISLLLIVAIILIIG